MCNGIFPRLDKESENKQFVSPDYSITRYFFRLSKNEITRDWKNTFHPFTN